VIDTKNKTYKRQNPSKSFAGNAAALVFVCIGMMAYFLGLHLCPILESKWGVEHTKFICAVVFVTLEFCVGIPFALVTFNFVNYLEEKNPIKREPSQKWICPKCSKTNPSKTFKCSKCGYSVV